MSESEAKELNHLGLVDLDRKEDHLELTGFQLESAELVTRRSGHREDLIRMRERVCVQIQIPIQSVGPSDTMLLTGLEKAQAVESQKFVRNSAETSLTEFEATRAMGGVRMSQMMEGVFERVVQMRGPHDRARRVLELSLPLKLALGQSQRIRIVLLSMPLHMLPLAQRDQSMNSKHLSEPRISLTVQKGNLLSPP